MRWSKEVVAAVITGVAAIIAGAIAIVPALLNDRRDSVIVEEKIPNVRAEFITGSEWNMLGGSTGKTFPVKVIANDGTKVTFQMPAGTLDVPLNRIEVVAVQGRVIRIF